MASPERIEGLYRGRLEQRTKALAAVTREHLEARLEATIRAEMEAKVGAELEARRQTLQAKEKRLRTVADDLLAMVQRIRQVLGFLARLLTVKQTGRLNADLEAIEQAAQGHDFGPDPEEQDDDHREGFRM